MIVGGFSLSRYELDWEIWKILECVFVLKEWAGWWCILAEEIQKSDIIFTYSKRENFFKKIWFKVIKWQKSQSWADLFIFRKPKYKIAVIWSTGAVWIHLQWLLEEHPVFSKYLSKPTLWLSAFTWAEWKKKVISILSENELVVLAVHDDIAKEIIYVKEEMKLATKLVDCSNAHRSDPSWVYGLPELKGQRRKIELSEFVANPWCHATAVILSIKPLNLFSLVEPSAIVSSITGYSGGWKELIQQYQEDNNISGFQYSVAKVHKHESEIKKQAWLQDLIFQLEVANYFNGLKTNTFLPLTHKWKALSEDKIIQLFLKYYKWEKFIKILAIPSTGKILMNENNGTQRVSIYIKKYSNTIQVITVIDNMMKGAAWAAIQNINIMLGVSEDIWLEG